MSIALAPQHRIFPLLFAALTGVCLLTIGCGEFVNSKPETFYSETTPPRKQEFRWSNGKMPKSFDPALASAPPETDIVRAVYEGLTDTNPKSLEAIPAVALSWTSADETRIWTFKLRRDALWSNGEKLTAHDFVRSWKRLADLGDKASHHSLLHNLAGIHNTEKRSSAKESESLPKRVELPAASSNSNANTASPGKVKPQESPDKLPLKELKHVPFGVEALSDFELRITLKEPDDGLPRLVAHPMFRPVYGTGDYFEETGLDANIVTNGAFRIASVGKDGVTLDRDDRYFDRSKIKLERVRFIPTDDPDAALASYKKGEVDVVTNVAFEPLALKLLTPFVDFKRTTHSALNFYEFNLKQAPFNDKRVREALAIAIDRERLTAGEMEGSTKPAFDYLPFESGREGKFGSDAKRAKELLENAGFPDGAGFPKIRLLVNRNNTQEKIARSVAKMWKDSLNVETELIIQDLEELEKTRKSAEFDLVRRGVLLPTSDETANMLAIFSADKVDAEEDVAVSETPSASNSNTSLPKPKPKTRAGNSNTGFGSIVDELVINTGVETEPILTEKEAIASIPAIPLYFPTSYSLVKPYVLGFEMNTLDAPSLKNVYIDSNWQPSKKKPQS